MRVKITVSLNGSLVAKTKTVDVDCDGISDATEADDMISEVVEEIVLNDMVSWDWKQVTDGD